MLLSDEDKAFMIASHELKVEQHERESRKHKGSNGSPKRFKGKRR